MTRRPSEPPPPAIAIILARRGSKGVPGKNVAMVGGRPCIAWTIDAAIQARGVGLVAVSTDDPDAESVARSFGSGVMVIHRPRALAGDRATIDAAARHAALAIERALGRDQVSDAGRAPRPPVLVGRTSRPQALVGRTSRPLAPVGRTSRPPVLVGRTSRPPSAAIVILYANVPIRPVVQGVGLIDRALDTLARTGCDSVQSYAPVGKFHPWWTARVNGRTGEVSPWQGRVLNHGIFRRQELPPAFVPDGGVIALTCAALFCERGAPPGPHAFFGRDRRGIANAEGSVVDIDSPVDLLVADAVLRDGRL